MPRSRTDSLSPLRKGEETLPFVYDIIIVGAGPCGLAVAARLKERTPSALFTDEEHTRYHWIRKHTANAAIKNSKTGRVRAHGSPKTSTDAQPSMLVLDSSGDSWMCKWKRLFGLLQISHLRSPMFFHPDPRDRDGLLAHMHEVGREHDCLEIAGCVGKEISKHRMKNRRRNKRGPGEQSKPTITIDERDRKDYFCPPSDLFQDYCDSVANRYGLLDDEAVQKAEICDIDYDFVQQLSPEERLFTLKSDSSTYFARNVVLAVGAGNAPSIPKPFPQDRCPRACHAFQPSDQALSQKLRESRRANVLVLGGGLTSAQIADRSLQRGATRVFHMMRGPLKVKPFDVDLGWMGKFRNHEKASFWSADTDEGTDSSTERLQLVQSARGGGSITPRFKRILDHHVKGGKLSIHTHTIVDRAAYDPVAQTWTITTDPPIAGLPAFDFVYFATGVQSDFKTLPYLQSIGEKYPISAYDGLPALTDDLQWHPDVPLFITGKLASIRLGPGAGNLEGARLGAERIAWALQDILGQSTSMRGNEREDRAVHARGSEMRYASGIGSRFEALEVS